MSVVCAGRGSRVAVMADAPGATTDATWAWFGTDELGISTSLEVPTTEQDSEYESEEESDEENEESDEESEADESEVGVV